jgi:hypothetical protein
MSRRHDLFRPAGGLALAIATASRGQAIGQHESPAGPSSMITSPSPSRFEATRTRSTGGARYPHFDETALCRFLAAALTAESSAGS